MSKQRQALRFALRLITRLYHNGEELEDRGGRHSIESEDFGEMSEYLYCFIEEIKDALAEPEQEPVAWIMRNPPYEDGAPNPCNTIKWAGRNAEDDFESETPLYTAPPARKPLTNDQLWTIWRNDPSDDSPEWFDQFLCAARAIERAHGIGEV